MLIPICSYILSMIQCWPFINAGAFNQSYENVSPYDTIHFFCIYSTSYAFLFEHINCYPHPLHLSCVGHLLVINLVHYSSLI